MVAFYAMNLESLYLSVLTGELSKLGGGAQDAVTEGLKTLSQKIVALFLNPI